MKSLRDRVAVITGAGGGLGRALAAELASHGCHVALVDVDTRAVEDTARALADRPIRVSQHTADVTDAERMQALPAEIVAVHGAIHVLVNNAGITIQKSFATHSLADWDRMIGINLWGVIHGCHFFREELLKADQAHLVNLSSMAAFVGLPGQSSYCATKSAVKALSESIWAEWALDGIGVTSVHPGAIRTEMIQATLAESDDVAAAQKNYELAQRMGVDPAYAARKIVEAVLKGKLRVRIGRDSLLLDWLKRIAPVQVHRPLLRIARQQRPGR